MNVALAAVFIAFKAADYIPGPGRVKMQQLIDAFERCEHSTLSEEDHLRICQTEMDILCLTGFNFDPYTKL